MQHALGGHPLGAQCPGCGQVYPVVEGTPIVLRDVDAWLQQEAPSLLCRADLPPPLLARLIAGAGGSLRRDLRLGEVYARSQRGPLQDWMRAQARAATGDTVDLGCGSAVYQEPRILGLDLNWALLRGYAGRRVLADACDPPFAAARFDTVLLFNLLDSCRDPFLLLQQADALVRPGGALVLSCAFAWQDEITPPRLQIDEAFLLGYLAHRGYTLAESQDLAWPLQVSARTRHEHRCLALVARRAT